VIGYRISKVKLEALIDAEAPGRGNKPSWLERAAARTAEFRANGRYEEKNSIWSEVKVVYMRLQGNCKCAYCERKLEGTDLGKIEQDVEHFRPKGSVKAWKAPKALTDQGIAFTAAPPPGKGYYLLPYHPFNYSAACKPCNSSLKKDFFPIAGAYDLQGDDPVKLQKEKPYLICPIGDFDDAAEDLIKFYGVSPQAVAAAGHGRARALVTIEFFKLDDEAKRKNLLRERAVVIIALHPQMEKLASGATGSAKKEAQKIVDGFTAPNAPHTNCARSFKNLFKTDPAEAKALFDRASNLISSIS
jgi:hypothetical protein